MRTLAITFLLFPVSVLGICPSPIPADNHGLSSLSSDGGEIIVYSQNPCLIRNIAEGFDHGVNRNGGEVHLMNVSVYPFKEGSTCPGQFFKGAPEYEACFVRREEYWMVDRQSVMFTSHPATDDMIVDIRQQGNGPRTQKFSIKRSEIYDAEGKFMIEECLPANCRAYTFNRFGKAHFLTVKSRPDGTVETRFIVNAGGESHITYLPRATRDQQRRAYYFQDEERRKRYEALGYGQIKLRQCYPED